MYVFPLNTIKCWLKNNQPTSTDQLPHFLEVLRNSTWIYFYQRFGFCIATHCIFTILKNLIVLLTNSHIFSCSGRFNLVICFAQTYIWISQGPQCVFNVKNTVEHLIRVWGHHYTDLRSFPVPHTHHSFLIMNRMSIFFSTLNLLPYVLHHSSHIYHAVKWRESFFVELKSRGDVFVWPRTAFNDGWAVVPALLFFGHTMFTACDVLLCNITAVIFIILGL